jgi:hypothetical protein
LILCTGIELLKLGFIGLSDRNSRQGNFLIILKKKILRLYIRSGELSRCYRLVLGYQFIYLWLVT